MFDPANIAKTKQAQALKKRAAAEVQNFVKNEMPTLRRNAIERIAVAEVMCSKEDCSPFDTVVTIYWLSGDETTRAIAKRIAEVTASDVRECLADISGAYFAPIIIEHSDHWDIITADGVVRTFVSEDGLVHEIGSFLDLSSADSPDLSCVCGDVRVHIHGLRREYASQDGDLSSPRDLHVKLIEVEHIHRHHDVVREATKNTADQEEIDAGQVEPVVKAFDMINFNGTAAEMLAGMRSAGISSPDAAEAAMRVANAPSSFPSACNDPFCSHEHHSSVSKEAHLHQCSEPPAHRHMPGLMLAFVHFIP